MRFLVNNVLKPKDVLLGILKLKLFLNSALRVLVNLRYFVRAIDSLLESLGVAYRSFSSVCFISTCVFLLVTCLIVGITGSEDPGPEGSGKTQEAKHPSKESESQSQSRRPAGSTLVQP